MQAARQRPAAVAALSERAFVSVTVLLEFEWVMRGFYTLPRRDIVAAVAVEWPPGVMNRHHTLRRRVLPPSTVWEQWDSNPLSARHRFYRPARLSRVGALP